MRPALVDVDPPMVEPGGHLDTSPVGGQTKRDHPAEQLQAPDPQRQTGYELFEVLLSQHSCPMRVPKDLAGTEPPPQHTGSEPPPLLEGPLQDQSSD
ncbi:hypothetical protein JEQ12_001894 [Ovis aries]|uniref:Uncharacterized protein n=1 Tax=Ovis aries TaxID=9940 RepID=A0A836AQS4_SHEEP|nr:hypothetical protein JEQ12_001894 [Ovis aries]